MPSPDRRAAVVLSLALALALAPPLARGASDSGGASKSTAGKPSTTAAPGNAQKCAQLKKKIADYEAAAAAAPKGAKVPGGESIKSDIAWVRSNCG